MNEKVIENYGIQLASPQCIHPKEENYPELRDPRQIEKAIIAHIKMNAVFLNRRCSTDLPGENSGVLICDFLLSEIKKICGGCLDELLLKSLDNLAASGKLLFRAVGIRKFMRPTDLYFVCQFAEVTKSNPPQIVVKVQRLYFEQPLTLAERKKLPGNIILDISQAVREIRARRDAHFKKRFGDRSNEIQIEKQIRAEERAVRIEEHKALMANLGKRAEVPDIKP